MTADTPIKSFVALSHSYPQVVLDNGIDTYHRNRKKNIMVFVQQLILWIANAPARIHDARQSLHAKAQSGADSVEWILVILAAVAIVGTIVAAVTAFVNGKIGGL